MSSTGAIPFKQVLKMLKECADGFVIEDKKHTKWVSYNEKKYHLPLGKHGSGARGRNNFSIEIGHIRGMVRSFGITACAEGKLEQLR